MARTDKKDIGDIYRDAFEDYSLDPSPRVWEVVEQHPAVSSPPQSWWMKPGNIFLGIAGAGIIAASAYFLSPRDGALPDASEEIVVEESSKPVEKENIIALQENVDETKEAVIENSEEPVNNKPDQSRETSVNTNSIPIISKEIGSDEFDSEEINTAKPITKSVVLEPEKIGSNATIVLKTPEPSPEASSAPENIPAEDIQAMPLQENPETEFDILYSEDKTICEGDETRLGVSGGATYYWSNGEITDSVTVSPAVTSVFRITAYNNDGYSKFGEIIVNVERCAKIFVPNTFTPNYDGINDEFKAVGTGFLDFRMIITDKSGSILFEATDVNFGWDGTYKGQPAEVDSYFYIIYYTDGDGQQKTLKGRLMLLR